MRSRNREQERAFMVRALRLAERGRGHTSPNPVVGAVIVRGGRIVGEGWHRALGHPHAEQEALLLAGRRARGATMFVTLEPCAHSGRTPPCVDALIEAGIRRCVVATRDPHDIVNGRGLRLLRRAGVRVEVGSCASLARRALGGYWKVHTRGLPRVTWKVAATFDGRIADGRGRSRWITGLRSRRRVHRMRAEADAVVIGARTALLDDPRLTARGARGARQPLRVVCDGRLELPSTLRLFGPSLARGTIVACTRSAPAARVARLERRGVRVWRMPGTGAVVSPAPLARRLAADGRHELLVEGGAGLGTSWFRAGLVDRIALFIAPRLLGAEGLDWCGKLGLGGLGSARAGRIVDCTRFGDDVLVELEV
jgi:diaminohydroxyphosphoribosylaminopyrimidine deaminase/5-amino-6-(5-phosphoribosylamino)uracil reductase